MITEYLWWKLAKPSLEIRYPIVFGFFLGLIFVIAFLLTLAYIR